MIHIKIQSREHQFRVALAFTQVFDGRERHGMVKHIRDNRRAWRKATRSLTTSPQGL